MPVRLEFNCQMRVDYRTLTQTSYCVSLFILNFATKKCSKNAEVNCNTILSDGLKIKIKCHIYKGENIVKWNVELNSLLTWKTWVSFLVIFPTECRGSHVLPLGVISKDFIL